MTEGAPRNLDVPPGPVRGPRGGGRVAFVALGALVIALASAVGLAQLVPAPVEPVRVSFAVPTLAPSVAAGTSAPRDTASPAPDPAAILAGTTPRMRRDALAAAVLDGSLDGRIVFIDGTLDVTPVRCQSLAQGSGGCVTLAIPGIGLPVWQGESATPWPGAPPPGSWLVTVARTAGLVYLGSLVPRRGETPSVSGLPAFAPPAQDGTLFETRGYLVRNPVHTCFRPGVAATPCPPPPPFLAEDEPLPEGLLTTDAGEAVSLAPSMPEVDPDAIVVPGTFLVQRVDGGEGGWLVVARYEPSRAARVLVP
ncbi:MAG TPA: hypothetical protein VES19_15660 [Candidatus Limnocylindrales bacterium]|nr:hypothetical protein [Candidatus Limnocylindrales bacterium]